MRLVSRFMLFLGLLSVLLFSWGCSTTAKFQVPPGSELEINNKPVEIRGDGTVKTGSFSYNAADGVPYVLKRKGKEIGSGKLETKWNFWRPIWAPYIFRHDEYNLSASTKGGDSKPPKKRKKKKKNG